MRCARAFSPGWNVNSSRATGLMPPFSVPACALARVRRWQAEVALPAIGVAGGAPSGRCLRNLVFIKPTMLAGTSAAKTLFHTNQRRSPELRHYKRGKPPACCDLASAASICLITG
jgi:hypothetical protein